MSQTSTSAYQSARPWWFWARVTPFVIVIGAGQARLAAGYYLKRARLPFRIIDGSDRVGDSWRQRYASLTLFTPRALSALPPIPLEGNRDGYATRDEFAAYLEAYADQLELPVTCGARAARLSLAAKAGFEAMLDTGDTINASHVIVATGGFQTSVTHPAAKDFAEGVVQLKAETYRNRSLPSSSQWLVVGDGATGRDVAVELAANFRSVLLATGKPRKLFPEHILGKSTWWWLRRSGLMQVSSRSLLGHAMQRADPFPDRDRNLESLRQRGIRVVPRLVGGGGKIATFADGTNAEISGIAWAIGHRDDSAWVDIPAAKDPDGAFLHHQGVSPVPGLFFVGRPWQRNRASALIMGAGDDAEAIVRRISKDPAITR